MSYTPDDQLLEPALDDILSGIKRLQQAILERRKNRNEWNYNHLQELTVLSSEIILWDEKLRILKNKTR